MTEEDDRLGRLEAALEAFLLSQEECRKKYEDFEAAIEAAVDPLTAMAFAEFDEFRNKLHAKLLKATQGRESPLSWPELEKMIDSAFTHVSPELFSLLGKHEFREAGQTDSRAASAHTDPNKCHRCDRAAKFHFTERADKAWTELHLCERHAREHLTGDSGT